jgi:hypothetical protein
VDVNAIVQDRRRDGGRQTAVFFQLVLPFGCQCSARGNMSPAREIEKLSRLQKTLAA